MPQAAELPNDIEALKGMLLERSAKLEAAEALVISQRLELEKLRFEIASMKRMKYGRSSEQLDRDLLQMQLSIEDLEASLAAKPPEVRPAAKEPAPEKPARRPLPVGLAREEIVHENPCTCPDCGGKLRPLGEDVAEILEYVPSHFKVIRHVRPKLSCASCQRIVQPLAPSRPIERGLAGPGLLAHVLVSKYCDHLPLYRQSQIFAREGIELDRSTLADWVGGASALLEPLVNAIGRYVLGTYKIHGDDTPVPVLCPGRGTTKQGRLWTYVRDDRPAGSLEPSAVIFRYSPDRKGERPRTHLANFTGVLQADAYAGFDRLYGEKIQEAACWAHVRRKFSHDRLSSRGTWSSFDTVCGRAVVHRFSETRVRTPRVSQRSLLLSFGDWCPIVISSRRAASTYDRRSERVGSINLPEDSLNRSRRPGSCLADKCFPGYLRRSAFVVCSDLGGPSAQESQLLRDRPDKAEQLACDCGHRDLTFLAAGNELAVTPAQSCLCLPSDRLQAIRGRGHSAQHAAADLRRAAIGPGRLDQETANYRVAGLGDAARMQARPARVLSRHEAQVSHQLSRIAEPLQISDLGDDADRDRFSDTAQRLQCANERR